MFDGKKLNSPFESVVRADGNVYFTDPNFGAADPANNQLPFEGVRPRRGRSAFGRGRRRRVVGAFAKLINVPGGLGIAVDDAVNLYVARADGVTVFAKSGKKLGVIVVPSSTKAFSCTFGGADRRTLFIVANGAAGDPATVRLLHQAQRARPGLFRGRPLPLRGGKAARRGRDAPCSTPGQNETGASRKTRRLRN